MKKIVSFFVLVLAHTLSAAQDAGYRDFVNAVIQPRQIESTTASGSVGGIGPVDGAQVRPGSQTLQLTISKVEGLEHKAGEVLIYEVKILNSSNQVIKIPWAINPREIEPAQPGPYEYWMATLEPHVMNPSGYVEVLEAVFLYGSDAGSTMFELFPGHWVRVRAKSRLQFREPAKMATSVSSGEFPIRISAVWTLDRVSFSQQNGHYHENFVPSGRGIASGNSVSIQITTQNDH